MLRKGEIRHQGRKNREFIYTILNALCAISSITILYYTILIALCVVSKYLVIVGSALCNLARVDPIFVLDRTNYNLKQKFGGMVSILG